MNKAMQGLSNISDERELHLRLPDCLPVMLTDRKFRSYLLSELVEQDEDLYLEVKKNRITRPGHVPDELVDLIVEAYPEISTPVVELEFVRDRGAFSPIVVYRFFRWYITAAEEYETGPFDTLDEATGFIGAGSEKHLLSSLNSHKKGTKGLTGLAARLASSSIAQCVMVNGSLYRYSVGGLQPDDRLLQSRLLRQLRRNTELNFCNNDDDARRLVREAGIFDCRSRATATYKVSYSENQGSKRLTSTTIGSKYAGHPNTSCRPPFGEPALIEVIRGQNIVIGTIRDKVFGTRFQVVPSDRSKDSLDWVADRMNMRC